jgi:hypothetical protein
MHGVCIFSLRDLSLLITRHEFFANKFILDYDPIAYQCMEEWIFKQSKSQLTIKTLDYCNNPILKIYNKDYYCE